MKDLDPSENGHPFKVGDAVKFKTSKKGVWWDVITVGTRTGTEWDGEKQPDGTYPNYHWCRVGNSTSMKHHVNAHRLEKIDPDRYQEEKR